MCTTVVSYAGDQEGGQLTTVVSQEDDPDRHTMLNCGPGRQAERIFECCTVSQEDDEPDHPTTHPHPDLLGRRHDHVLVEERRQPGLHEHTHG